MYDVLLAATLLSGLLHLFMARTDLPQTMSEELIMVWSGRITVGLFVLLILYMGWAAPA